MKKIILVLSLVVLPLLMPIQSLAVSRVGIAVKKEAREEIRHEIINEIKNKVSISITPAQIKKNIMEKVKETVAKNLTFGARISGEIKSINDKTFVVEADAKEYEVMINDKTQLRRRFWGKAQLAEFSIGNKVNVIGKWTDDSKTKINAILVRNLSIEKRWGVFFGDVTSKTDNSFVIKALARGEETVYPASSTKYVDRSEKTISLTDIKIGDRVRVKGVWDRTLKKITEVDQVKDFSIPARPTATPTVSQ